MEKVGQTYCFRLSKTLYFEISLWDISTGHFNLRYLLILKDSWSGLFIVSRLFHTFFLAYSYGFCQMDNELFFSDAHSSKGDKARFSGVNDFQNDIVGAE